MDTYIHIHTFIYIYMHTDIHDTYVCETGRARNVDLQLLLVDVPAEDMSERPAPTTYACSSTELQKHGAVVFALPSSSTSGLTLLDWLQY